MNRRQRTRRASRRDGSIDPAPAPLGNLRRALTQPVLDGLLLGFVLYVTLEITNVTGRSDPSSATSLGDRLLVSSVAAFCLTMILTFIGPSRVEREWSRLAVSVLAASIAFSISIAMAADAFLLHLGLLTFSPELVTGAVTALAMNVLAHAVVGHGSPMASPSVSRPDSHIVATPEQLRAHAYRSARGSTSFAATRSTRAALAHEQTDTDELSALADPLRRPGHASVHLVTVGTAEETELAEPIRISIGTDWPRHSDRSLRRLLKRMMDLGVAITALILLSPLLAALAILIKLESRGPALYVQARVGADGKTFNLLKFRSMRLDAEECTGPVFATPNDPRCTRIGHFIRCHSLDEIPQLINVVRGDMSIVGPRPERPYFVMRFSQTVPHYAERHREKAGITGWAQVNGWRGDTSIEERVEFDLYYVENWSLLFDLKIMVRTIVEILGGHNAY